MSGDNDSGWKGLALTILVMLLLLALAFSNQIADWLGRVLP